MGVLVRVAQDVENRVSSIRQQSEPKLKLTLREARAELLELKSQTQTSTWDKTELHTRAAIARVDTRLWQGADQSIERIILELERVRHRLVRAA